MSSDPLGKRLVRALLKEKTFIPITTYHVDERDLFDDAKEAYQWVMGYWTEKGLFPTVKMLEEVLELTFPDEDETLDFVANQIRKRTLGKKLERQLLQAAEKLESRDPDAALELIREASTYEKIGSVSSYRLNGPSRIKVYDEVKSAAGIKGIRTQWKSLNDQIQGWVDGSLNVVVGLFSVGKSWFCILNAVHCLELGKKVLLVTMEMDAYRIERRLDSIVHKIPFGDLRDASLDMFTEEKWKETLLKDVEGDGDILVADKKVVEKVSDVSALFYEYRPDIVIIDGGYRFKGSGKSHWESTVSIVGDLQLAAEVTNVPWVVTTQQGDSRETGIEKKRGPKLNAWGVRYGKEWVINPDTTIGLYQNKELRLKQQLEIHILKAREIDGEYREPVFNIWWDRLKMHFGEVLEDRDDVEEIGLETKVEF